MHVTQRSARATTAVPPSASASEALGRGASSNAPAGIAGIGAGRPGATTSYRSFASADHRAHHDYKTAPHRNAFESAQPPDVSQAYGDLPSAQSTSPFDTQSRAVDVTTSPSSSSLHSSQSMQPLLKTSIDSAASVSASSSSSSNSRAISEAELLAFIEQKRTEATTVNVGKQSKLPPNYGRDRGVQSKSATDSSNPLDTLDLCHKRIDRVTDALVDSMKDQVVRLALGYNHLTRLPDTFAELSNLRYLNIRANNFAHLPDCVTKMPNLEILDLSRNKVRKLPELPGRLLALRVLSMNANRLTELPSWIGKMKHLRILKLDNNPLQWPPPHISKMPNVAPPKPPSSSGSSSVAEREKVKRFEDRQMLVWIAKLRSWINDPANQPQRSEVKTSEQQTATESKFRAQESSEVRAQVDNTPSTEHADFPPSQSDGLMSLQVQVPQSLSDRTLRPDAAEIMPSDALQTSSASTALIEAHALSPGLLPSLVPRSQSVDNDSTQAEGTISSTLRGVSSLHSAQQRMLNSQTPSTSTAEASTDHQSRLAGRIVHEDRDARQHARNNSHSVAQDIAATHQMESRRSLKSKKSLPDLRKSHQDILQERRDALADLNPPDSAQQSSHQKLDDSNQDYGCLSGPSSSASIPTAIAVAADNTDAPSTLPHNAVTQLSDKKPSLQARRVARPSLGNGLLSSSDRQGYESAMSGPLNAPQLSVTNQGGGLRKLSLPTVGATQAAAEAAAAALAARHGYNHSPARFDAGHGRVASDRGDNNWPSRSGSPTVNVPCTAADQERNSYFRRLSTLPPSTISKAVPVPVLKFVDGTRGVLFALSQIHAAIGQFMTPVIDERISSQFHRLLDISNGSVANLINALDRFDSLSRRGTPDPSVIRGVLITCKDSVITFRKLISVLQLQLRALQSSSDVRYARTLLLMLYGSMAEVSNSWTEMAPLVEAVQPYLTQADLESGSPASSEAVNTGTCALVANEKPTPTSTRSGTLLQKSISNNSNGSTSVLPSIAEASTPTRAGSRPYIARGPSRRRHAGSFSAQDLAQGAAMTPSTSNQPPFNLEDLQAASAYNTPARGARNRRQGSMGNSASSAAAFAQSDTSDRSAVVDGIQSTAPSTPGGSASTTPALRNTYATPGAMSTPASSRQKRSGSNASSAMETGTPPATGTTKRALPAAMTSSVNAATAVVPTAAGSRLRTAVSDPKITIDDHLLEMVDNITKLSARVWSLLFEHLRSAGIDDPSTTASEPSPVEDQPGLASDEAQGPESDGEKDVTQDKIAADASDELAQKLRELRELAQITDDLTSQLRSTYLRAREEEQRGISINEDVVADSQTAVESDVWPNSEAIEELRATPAITATSPDKITAATATELFDDSHQFVRAIVNTSTLIKAISISHEFPRDVRRLLGQVAQACSNLTVYLLWLSPSNVA